MPSDRAGRSLLVGQGLRFAASGGEVALVYIATTTLLAEVLGVPFEVSLAIGFTLAIADKTPNAPIEGGGKNGHGDKHVLVVQEGTCTLYELYKAKRKGDGWTAAASRLTEPR